MEDELVAGVVERDSRSVAHRRGLAVFLAALVLVALSLALGWNEPLERRLGASGGGGWGTALAVALLLSLAVLVWAGMRLRELRGRAAVHDRELRELTFSEARFRTMIEYAPEAICLVDADRLRFLDVNENFSHLLHYAREELLAMGPVELSPEQQPDGRASAFVARDWVERAMAGGPQVFEWLCLAAGGEEVPVEVHLVRLPWEGRNVLIGIASDVRHRKASEEALRKSEAQFRSVFDNAEMGIAISNMQGRFLRCNQAMQRLLDYTEEELIEGGLALITHPDDLDASRRAMQDLISGRREFVHFEKRYFRRDGETIWVKLVASLGCSPSGAPEFVIGMIADTTELKHTERQLRESRQEMREYANRLQDVREEERGKIAREVHDELGQALTGIKMELAWLLEQLPEGAGPLHARAGAMLDLVDGTMSAVRRIATSLRPAVLDDLGLEAAVEWQVRDFSKRTGCQCRLDSRADGLEPRRNRDTAVFRILQEALTNVARHAEAWRVDVALLREGEDLLLSVKDDGKGFLPDDDPESAGIGVTGMRERAAALGGEIGFERPNDGGTLVRLRVPVHSSQPELPPAPDDPPPDR